MLRLWTICVQSITVQGSRTGACGLWVLFQKTSLQAVAAMTLCEDEHLGNLLGCGRTYVFRSAKKEQTEAFREREL